MACGVMVSPGGRGVVIQRLNQGKNQWLNVVNVLRGAAAAAGTTFNVENTIQYSPRDYQVVQVAQLYFIKYGVPLSKCKKIEDLEILKPPLPGIRISGNHG